MESMTIQASPEAVSRQRLRVSFTRDVTLKYIGHLDMAKAWQRILRRANLPLAYSEGFNPQPKITFAAALPVGCTSDHEVLDMMLAPALEIEVARAQLERALPPGIKLRLIEAVPLKAPALQAQLLAADFEIVVEEAAAITALPDRVRAFWAATGVARERRGKPYNLRPLVQSLTIEPGPDRAVIRSRLQATEGGTGRPDELIAALGVDPTTTQIKRRRLIFIDKTS
jgi:radical SAM-linked protein